MWNVERNRVKGKWKNGKVELWNVAKDCMIEKRLCDCTDKIFQVLPTLSMYTYKDLKNKENPKSKLKVES